MDENVRSFLELFCVYCVIFVGDFLNFISLIFNSTTDTPTLNSPLNKKQDRKKKKTLKRSFNQHFVFDDDEGSAHSER